MAWCAGLTQARVTGDERELQLVERLGKASSSGALDGSGWGHPGLAVLGSVRK